MPQTLVVVNTVLFAALGLYSFTIARRAPAGSIRKLWRLAVLPAVAVVIGGIQRLAVQGVRLGWLPDSALDVLLVGGQTVQSIVVSAIGVYTFVNMRQLASRLYDVETVVGDMVDRIDSVRLDSLALTKREREVLEVLGASSNIDDRSLADRLSISPDTVHTHVSSLLKKTKLRDRRDLRVVAFLLKARQSEAGRLR